MTTCAIHQPNFLPWLPYFDKISKADIFIFLDRVAYPKSGNSMGSWCNRVKINMNGQEIWFACPVQRESGIQPIETVKINYAQLSFDKWIYTLECAYARYANFKFVKNLIFDTFNENYVFFADFNIALIKKICTLLNISTAFVKQSDLDVFLSSNEMLIELCHKVSATKYLSGTGAVDYMDDEQFTANNIQVIYQNQTYPEDINLIKKYSIIHYLITTDRKDWGNFNA